MKQFLTSLLLLTSIYSYSQWNKVSSASKTSMLNDSLGIVCSNTIITSTPYPKYHKTIHLVDGNWVDSTNWIQFDSSINQLIPDSLFIRNVHLISDSIAYFEVNEGNTIYKTSNQGQSYSAITINTPSNYYHSLDFISENTFVFASDKVIYSVKNDNIQDTLLFLGVDTFIYKFKFHPISNNSFYLSSWCVDSLNFTFPIWISYLQIYKYDLPNLNNKNRLLNVFSAVHDNVSFPDSLNGYWRNNNQILKTTDGGRNWSLIGNFNGQIPFNNMEFINDSIGFITADSGRIYTSYSGGLSWLLEPVNESNFYPSKIEVFDNNSVGIFGVYNEEFYYLRDFVTSTNKVKEIKNISIYPNPANNEISFNSVFQNNSNYSIINISGKVIQQGSLDYNSINISNLLKGIYLLRIETKDKIHFSKFIKE